METSAHQSLFPTLGPWFHRQIQHLASMGRALRRLYVGVSLRALLVFVLVLGGLLGWYVRSVRIQQGAVAAIENTAGSVFYDVQDRNEGPGSYYKPFGLRWLFHARDLAPKWLVDRIGLDYVGGLVNARLGLTADDETMVQVGQLDRLETLWLNGTSVTDAGLVHVQGLTLLRDLRLSQTRITDASLARLKNLKDLRTLDLSRTQVTDEGVLELQEALPWLQVFRDEDMTFSAAVPRAIKDLDFARTQPIRLACLLLAHRAERAAHRGERAELIETADALCTLEASDKFSLLKLASACASCVRSVDLIHSTDLPAEEKHAIQERLARHGIAALARAVEQGFRTLSRPPQYSFWPLDRYPGFRELEAKLASPRSETLPNR